MRRLRYRHDSTVYRTWASALTSAWKHDYSMWHLDRICSRNVHAGGSVYKLSQVPRNRSAAYPPLTLVVCSFSLRILGMSSDCIFHALFHSFCHPASLSPALKSMRPGVRSDRSYDLSKLWPSTQEHLCFVLASVGSTDEKSAHRVVSAALLGSAMLTPYQQGG